MFPASVGFGSSAVAQHGTLQKPEATEQRFAAPEQEAEAPEAKVGPQANTDTAPVAPPSNGASLSVEAVTALQQVQEEQATTSRPAFNTAAVQQNDAFSQDQQPVVETVAGNQNAEQARQQNDAAQASEDARGDVPQNEETDNAGRSTRNPLDLQI